MRLLDVNTIDFLGIEKGTGCLSLTLVDELDWEDESRHLALLQAKLNWYLEAIESGEAYDSLTRRTGRAISKSLPIKVRVLSRYSVTEEGLRFFEYARGAGERLNVVFSNQVLPSPESDVTEFLPPEVK